MKAEELRLGNFIFCNKKYVSKMHIVSFSTFSQVKHDENKGTKKYTPISLNHDWLLKFGFDENGKYENGNYIFKVIFHDCWNISYEEKDLYGIGKCFLQGYPSVHQFQNLYFSFTGEELTLKAS